MPISQEKEAALRQRMERLGVREEEFQETFIRSSGPGGQKVNKTSSCVYLVHLPDGTRQCREDADRENSTSETAAVKKGQRKNTGGEASPVRKKVPPYADRPG
jgi:protein subunit release factor B